MKFYFPLLTLSTIILLFSCNQGNKKDNKKETETSNQITTPDFNADSAYYFVKQQVDFGPRIMNSKQHDECADFLINKVKSYNAKVIVQKGEVKAFDGKMLKIQNIIASFNPEQKNRVLLCSHWDTRPWADQDTVKQDEPIDGANDGASGVGVLLEIARNLASQPTTIGIDIIFLDAEDYGQPENTKYPRMEDSYALGTQYWAKNNPVQNYYANYGILLDMVGAPKATFSMEGISMQYASAVVKKVWDIAARLGYSDYFIYKTTSSITDDHYYVNDIAKVPCIDIIHHDPSTRSNFGTYWHTHQDNMNMIDKNTLKAVGQTLLEVIYREK